MHSGVPYAGLEMIKKKSISDVIKAARTRLKLSADDVAARCNVSRSRVYQWEAQGYVFPKNLPALSAALQVPVRRLKATNGRPSRAA